MSVVSSTDHDVTEEVRDATDAFMKALDNSIGEVLEDAARETTFSAAAIQLVLGWFMAQAEGLDDDKGATHAENVIRGIGSGVAAFFRNAAPGTITAVLSDIASGASEVEAHNYRQSNGRVAAALADAFRAVAAGAEANAGRAE